MKIVTYGSRFTGDTYSCSVVPFIPDWINISQLRRDLSSITGTLDQLVFLDMKTDQLVFLTVDDEPQIEGLRNMPIAEATVVLGGVNSSANLVARVKSYARSTQIKLDNPDEPYADRIIAIVKDDKTAQLLQQYFMQKRWETTECE